MSKFIEYIKLMKRKVNTNKHAVKLPHSAGDKISRLLCFLEFSTSACSLVRKFRKSPRSGKFIYTGLVKYFILPLSRGMNQYVSFSRPDLTWPCRGCRYAGWSVGRSVRGNNTRAATSSTSWRRRWTAPATRCSASTRSSTYITSRSEDYNIQRGLIVPCVAN